MKEQTGLPFAVFLERCRQVDDASLRDPASVAQRFGVAWGDLPATERQAAEMQAQAEQKAAQEQQQLLEHQHHTAEAERQYQERLTAASDWLGQLHQQGHLPPEWSRPEFRDAVADTLEYMNAKGMRTADIATDLGVAIEATRGVARTTQLLEDRDRVRKSKQASRSVSGSGATHQQRPAIVTAAITPMMCSQMPGTLINRELSEHDLWPRVPALDGNVTCVPGH